MKISKFFSRSDDKCYHKTDDCPTWLSDAIYEIHCKSSSSNYLYDLIHSFCVDYDNENIKDEDGIHEWADSQVDVYNSALYQFAADNSHYTWYDDESAKDLVNVSKDPLDMIKAVQYCVAQNVGHALLEAIQEAESESESEEEEEG